MNTVDVRKMLGNPKITFVLGRDAEFRSAVWDKLVEEFKYKYVSTEKLIEIENQKSKKKISDGGMVNYEAIVALLVNALIASPSKNYLIDGFPTTSEQAIYFEQNVCECQTILYFDEPAREEGDDPYAANPIINETAYRYNKVKFIDSTQNIEDVYKDTKRALLPEVFFLIGPKASGKSTIGSQLAERTNMKLMNFDTFVKSQSLKGADDETIVFELIRKLIDEVSPRILLESFPQNEVQAKWFMANCTEPAKVFYWKCSKDTCQERMITLGKNHPDYVSSAILSKRIKKFYDQYPTLLPLLQDSTEFYEIDWDQELQKVHKQIAEIVEPTIIHIRSGTNNDLKKHMITMLVGEHDFINLEVNSLIRMETERRTAVGQEFFQTVSAGKIIPADMIVKMLRKIIYSGQNHKRFILNGFPDIIEHVNEFEKNCAKISAIFLTTSQDENVVEIKNNNLTLFNIDALFQKEFRLKIIDNWDYSRFSEMLGDKTDYIIVTGSWWSGKTTVCKYLQSSYGYEIINHKDVYEECKKKHENDEEPPESIPLEEVLDELRNKIGALRQTRSKFVFDTLPGTQPEHFEAIFEFMGIPDYIMIIDCDPGTRKKRYLSKIEAEEWTDEHEEEVKNIPDNTSLLFEYARDRFAEVSPDRFRILEFNLSDDSMKKQINDELSPKVILVSHDKRLASDTTCANLAIKYNLIYISVYQLIRKQIEGNTEFGCKLLATKKPREIKISSQTKDEFQEADYSAIHFDLPLVLKLVKNTINEVLTNQKFILLEGFCNHSKLVKEEDILELRPMVELVEIERAIGEIVAIASLKFNQEKEIVEDEELIFEEFPEPPPVETKKVNDEGEGEPEVPVPQDEGEGDDKKEVFKVEDYQWTISNRKPRNLAQVYLDLKQNSAVHEVKNADEYSSSQYEAISKSLDEFITRVVEQDLRGRNAMIQIVFNE